MKPQFLRLCGFAAVLGGALFLIIITLGTTNLENTAIWPFIPLLPTLLTLGVAGLFAYKRPMGPTPPWKEKG